MKNTVIIMIMAALVLAFFSLPAKAEVVLVETTFEPDQPSAGDWDRNVSTLWDEPDIASGVSWTGGSYPAGENATIETNGGDASLNPSGAQFGKLVSTYGTRRDIELAFDADGGNGGIQVAQWYQKSYRSGSTTNQTQVWIKDRNDNVATCLLWQLNPSTWHLRVYTTDYTLTPWLTMDQDAYSWYHFVMTLDYNTQKITDFTISKGIYSGDSWTWIDPNDLLAGLDPEVYPNQEIPFVHSSSDSLDVLRLDAINGSTNTMSVNRFDDIKVSGSGSGPLVCGDPGTEYLPGDISGPEGIRDCYVDLYDFAQLVHDWLGCTDPANPDCF